MELWKSAFARCLKTCNEESLAAFNWRICCIRSVLAQAKPVAAAMTPDYYTVLGVERDARPAQIKKVGARWA